MTAAEDLRATFLAAGLTDAQLVELAGAGREIHFEPGDVLFEEGRNADHLWILLDGSVGLTRRIGDQVVELATMNVPGHWSGGLAAWAPADELAAIRATGTATESGRAFVVASDDLGRLVERWSPFARHLLVGVYQTIRTIDATARQRESLVALGTLAAGLAHEINNPAAASLRAVASLRETSGYMLSALAGLAHEGVVADRFLEVDRMRIELEARTVPEDSALERSDREEAIGEWMEHRGVELAWRIAPVLAAVGADRAWCEQLEAVVGDDALDPALRWVSSAVGSALLLSELGEATARIAHLVEDVKHYSELDRASARAVDLWEGLDSTLAILGPKLDGIDVVRERDAPVPTVEGYPAELNQVWTNLIDNALDAMGGRGTLRLRTSTKGDTVLVEIADTGGGIDAAVLGRVFEPFFTTKDVGAGTGLGLDISRRIVVDRHGGDLWFESGPDGTVAMVCLPMRR